MPTPLADLLSRLDDIEADVNFADLASSLRPRIGDALNWNVGNDTLKLAVAFMKSKDSRIEGVCGALFVRVVATFERYLRRLVESGVDDIARRASGFDAVPPNIQKKNLMYTGRVLSGIESPKDYQVFNYEGLVDNLATCKTGSNYFRLNSNAFSAPIVGSSPEVVERALKAIDVEGLWDPIGASGRLQKLLGTKKPRDTGTQAQERLQELSKKRNQIAHAGDSEPALTAQNVKDAIEFIRAFSECLDAEVQKQLAAM
jgi:RiboL-PSP-HEPN